MPRCRIEIRLVRISHVGRFIGDDWSYAITVGGVRKTISEASGRGGHNTSLRVNKTWNLVRECRTVNQVPVLLAPREHDIFFDDISTVSTAFRVRYPGPGGVIRERRDPRVTVRERPGGSRGNTIKFHFEITSKCR